MPTNRLVIESRAHNLGSLSGDDRWLRSTGFYLIRFIITTIWLTSTQHTRPYITKLTSDDDIFVKIYDIYISYIYKIHTVSTRSLVSRVISRLIRMCRANQLFVEISSLLFIVCFLFFTVFPSYCPAAGWWSPCPPQNIDQTNLSNR